MRSLVILTLLAIVTGACSHPADLTRIHPGMTRSEVISTLGEPRSKFVILNVEYLSYDQREIVLEHDTVISVDAHASDTSRIELHVSKERMDSLLRTMGAEGTTH